MVYDAYLQSAFVRDDEELTTPQEQLTQALAGRGSGNRRNEIQSWAKAFAKLNHLSLSEARFYALLAKLVSYPARKRQKSQVERDTKIFDDKKYLLNDVCDARLLAEQYLAVRRID